MTQVEKLNEIRDQFLPGYWPGLDVCSGWYDLILCTHAALIAIDPEYGLCQIKEKFGGLRYYISEGTDEMWAIVDAAEATSFKICEECGASGEVRNTGWIRTLCDEHYNAVGK
jgi:hypothetical protein